MHHRHKAAREQVALSRLQDAAASLAGKFGLVGAGLDLAAIAHRDAEIQRLYQMESLAAFLVELDEKLVSVAEESVTDKVNQGVLDLLGRVEISKTSRKAILHALGLDDADVPQMAQEGQGDA
jgi:hypothetical protein